MLVTTGADRASAAKQKRTNRMILEDRMHGDDGCLRISRRLR